MDYNVKLLVFLKVIKVTNMFTSFFIVFSENYNRKTKMQHYNTNGKEQTEH